MVSMALLILTCYVLSSLVLLVEYFTLVHLHEDQEGMGLWISLKQCLAGLNSPPEVPCHCYLLTVSLSSGCLAQGRLYKTGEQHRDGQVRRQRKPVHQVSFYTGPGSKDTEMNGRRCWEIGGRYINIELSGHI